MIILDGKSVKEKIRKELKEKFAVLSFKPTLEIIQVGDRSESNSYISAKTNFGKSIGVDVIHKKFHEGVSQSELIDEVEKINKNKNIQAVIIQLPLPQNFDKQKVIDFIDPKKDVDGLTSINYSNFLSNSSKFIVPATARGILELLNEYKIDLKNKKAVVIGRSNLVGRPVAVLLERVGAKVTVCHRGTLDLKSETIKADILISATGQPGLITKEHVKVGSVIVDVGINVVDLSDGTKKYTGDVCFGEVSKIVSAISPVPGGVGPMTVTALFENFYDICYSLDLGLE